MLVIGGRDMEGGQVSVRLHHGGPQGAKPKAEVVADILASIKERRALSFHQFNRQTLVPAPTPVNFPESISEGGDST